MTADDSLVINHDPVFHGLEIEKKQYKELLNFRLTNGEKIPTLREYILAGLKGNSSTRLVCEIKPSEISKERGRAIAEKVLALIKQLQAGPMVEYISFDYGILEKIIETDPHATTQYLAGDKSPAQLKASGVDGADYHYSVFKNNLSWIQSARENKIFLNVWTENTPDEMDWAIANKFDFITTNEPELLLERIRNAPTTTGWKLKWSEEFNYTGLPDSTKWGYETGGHGWGNNELQYYTAADTSNVFVKNGSLKITARIKRVGNNEYTSARLLTKNKAEFTYGRIEISAKLPQGRGLWPAIWMLCRDIEKLGWPGGGEIDIMEHVGFEKDTVLGTVHTTAYNHVINTQKGKKIFIDNPYTAYHLYAIEWTHEYIDFFVDEQRFLRFDNEHKTSAEWPFDKPFFLILNIAVGGNLGGQKGIDQNIFPSSMEVDYVRVYQK
jgi:glycerophosphoryl diester phosphodiesterase